MLKLPNDVIVRYFKIEKVENPFKITNIYTSDDFYNIADWNNTNINDSKEMSEALNKQVKRNHIFLSLINTACSEISYIKPPILNIHNTKTSSLELNTNNIDNDIKVCKNHINDTYNRHDVLSKDQDAFEYPSLKLKNNSVELYSIVITSKIGYTGHIYAWISPIDPTICSVIGIRSSVLMPFYRNYGWGGLSKVSSYILEGVRLFALNKGANKIVATAPIGKMRKILLINGFKVKPINNHTIGNAGKLTINNNKFCYNCYVKENITESFIQE